MQKRLSFLIISFTLIIALFAYLSLNKEIKSPHEESFQSNIELKICNTLSSGCEVFNSSELAYLSDEDLKHWFGFQDCVSDYNIICRIAYPDYGKQYDGFKSKIASIDMHLAKILSENQIFRNISRVPEIYVYRSRLSSESIKSTYNEPDVINAKDEVPVGYERKVLLKEAPTSDIIIRVEVLTKNEANGEYCFSQEGYNFFVDAIAKRVVYAASFSQSGCE